MAPTNGFTVRKASLCLARFAVATAVAQECGLGVVEPFLCCVPCACPSGSPLNLHLHSYACRGGEGHRQPADVEQDHGRPFEGGCLVLGGCGGPLQSWLLASTVAVQAKSSAGEEVATLQAEVVELRKRLSAATAGLEARTTEFRAKEEVFKKGMENMRVAAVSEQEELTAEIEVSACGDLSQALNRSTYRLLSQVMRC
jgi:hypothetical protein